MNLQNEIQIATAEKDAEIARLTEQIENAKSALGEHPDSPVDLAQRISEIRDEGRGHFHTVTRLQAELAAVRLCFAEATAIFQNSVNLKEAKDYFENAESRIPELTSEITKLNITVDTLTKHHRGTIDSRNAYAKNYRTSQVEVARLKGVVERLTKERDIFSGEAELYAQARYALEELTIDRDRLAAELETVKAERDLNFSNKQAYMRECDRLRAELEAFTKHVGATSFQEAVAVTFRTKEQDEIKIEEMFNKIKSLGRELAAAKAAVEAAFREAQTYPHTLNSGDRDRVWLASDARRKLEGGR